MSVRVIASIEYLHECLNYDISTGELVWKRRPRTHFKTNRACSTWNARYAFTEAGNVKENGRTSYRIIVIDYVRYRAHRIAFAMYYGKWPTDDIDHIDGIGTNNCIKNLRQATRSQNERNAKLHLNNTSGFNGVYWDKKNKKWRAQIAMDGKVKNLGRFVDINNAIAARRAAEQGHGFTERHGRES